MRYRKCDCGCGITLEMTDEDWQLMTSSKLLIIANGCSLDERDDSVELFNQREKYGLFKVTEVAMHCDCGNENCRLWVKVPVETADFLEGDGGDYYVIAEGCLSNNTGFRHVKKKDGFSLCRD